jgi:hypothetical protein
LKTQETFMAPSLVVKPNREGQNGKGADQMKTVQLSPPSIQLYDGRVHLALRDSHSKRQMRIEHPLQLYDDRECNLTYMITERGEFRVWQYAEVPPKVAHETGWHRSPALATFLRGATLSAVLLSFASRLSLLPQLTGGLGDVSATNWPRC